MSEIELARKTLVMAKKDLEAIKEMQNNRVIADEIVGFHIQQVVEKSLKAWIAALGFDYPLTHNIIELLTVLEEHGCEVEKFWDLVKYNSFAVQFRYEELEDFSGELDRAEATMKGAELFKHVEKIIDETASSE